MNKRINSIIISPKTSITEAMRRIQEGPHANPPSPAGIVAVTDGRLRLLGVVTDGDIRRALLGGINFKESVSAIMTKNPVFVRSNQTAQEMLGELYREIKKRNVSENKYHNIIVLDEAGEVFDIVTPFELWRRSEVKTKTAAIIGLGYVGLTLALTLNEFGIEVIGIDSNEEVKKKLNKGVPHFYENGLDKLLKKHIHKSLSVKSELTQSESDIYIICVSTPIDERGNLVSSYLKDAATNVGRVLKAHDLVILRSTVVIGTCRNFAIPILEKESGLRAGKDFFIAFAPERTVEGKALEELRTLPQIVGGYNKESADYATKLFQLFVQSIIPVADLETAEAVKLFNNTFRDVTFAFANEAAQICDGLGLNAREIIRAANEGYPRDKIPYPSPGVGGACLVKDPYIFVESAKHSGRKAKMPCLAREVNREMIGFVARKVDDFCSGAKKNPKEVKIFIMGVAFKGDPETSDIRDSTSVDIIKKLQLMYPNIYMYDPIAHKSDLESLDAKIVLNPRAGFRGADCALVLNNHPSYRNLDMYALAKSMKNPALIFDGWGMYSKKEFSPLHHITYMSL